MSFAQSDELARAEGAYQRAGQAIGQIVDPDSSDSWINNNNFKLPVFEPSSIDFFDKLCGNRRDNLCAPGQRVQAKESFSAAAKSLGVPATALMCLASIETNMRFGVVSYAGAKGLTQFMPGTASLYQNMIRSGRDSELYRKAWQKYEKLGGRIRQSSATNKEATYLEVKKENILSPEANNFDIQIFASAMYLRNTLNQLPTSDLPATASKEQIRSQGRKVMAALLASYNGGVSRALTYYQSITAKASEPESKNPFSKVFPQTAGYIMKFENCMGYGNWSKQSIHNQEMRDKNIRKLRSKGKSAKIGKGKKSTKAIARRR